MIKKSFWISVIFTSMIFGLMNKAQIAFTQEKALPEIIQQMVLTDIGFDKPIGKSFASRLFVSKLTITAPLFELQDASYEGIGEKTNLWRDKFFIPNEYLRKSVRTKPEQGKFDWGEYAQMVKGGIEDLTPTEKLRPYLLKSKEGIIYVTLAKRVMKSIDYVNKWKLNDLDTWSFTFTYFIDPSLPDLPRLGPFEGKGTAMLNPATGKFDTVFEKDVGRRYGSSLGDSSDREYTAWLEKQSVTSKESSPSQVDDANKLKAFIRDQFKQILPIPSPKRDWRELVTLKITGKYDDYSSLYLLGVNRRNLASKALITAMTFLIKKDDLKNARKYADLGARHYIESNNLFNAAEQVFSGGVAMTAKALESIYRGSKEASKYGWYLMCGPKCYEVADYVFLMTDFAMDYGLEGMDEAKKNLVIEGFVKTLLKTGEVSNWIDNRTTHLIGDSGLYSLMDKTINSPEFQRAFMKVLAESGVYATQKMTETGAKTIIQNSLNFVKGSPNLKPK